MLFRLLSRKLSNYLLVNNFSLIAVEEQWKIGNVASIFMKTPYNSDKN